MLWVFHAGEKLFQTGWFVKSLATQTLVIFIIRTSDPLRDPPHPALVASMLGLPVAQVPGKVLYLAMDRPAQIARSLHRQFFDCHRDVLRDRLVIWEGPPPADIAAESPLPLLAELAERAGASVVYLDSLKDAAVGLAEDAVGAGYNRARRFC